MISDLLVKLKTANFLLGVAYAALDLARSKLKDKEDIQYCMDLINSNREEI
jgi:hypothetical protein